MPRNLGVYGDGWRTEQQTYTHLDDLTFTSKVPSHDEYCNAYISFTVQSKHNNFEDLTGIMI